MKLSGFSVLDHQPIRTNKPGGLGRGDVVGQIESTHNTASLEVGEIVANGFGPPQTRRHLFSNEGVRPWIGGESFFIPDGGVLLFNRSNTLYYASTLRDPLYKSG